ncbi:MAG: (d)CMP kinase [Phototrophicaceae bacterium]
MSNHTIAIDGTAGSGKSTLGKALAQKLGYFFLDTGILYRAISRQALNSKIYIHDESAIKQYAENLELTVQDLHPKFRFELNGMRVTDLYAVEIDKIVPIVAAHESVRLKVRESQRQIANAGNIILAGRDITTVVLPNADFKFYIQVSLDERANRRFSAQNKAHRSLAEIKEDLIERDKKDKNRHISPLKIAPDAIVICTDGLSIDDAIAEIMSHI